MKKIIVGFSHRPGNIVSSTICLLTGGDVSHTYIKIPVPEFNTSVIFGASGSNIHYDNETEFLKKNKVVAEIEVEVSDEQMVVAERFRVFECGKPYSLLELIGYAWVLLGRAFKKSWKNPFRDGNKSFVCVEAVTSCIGIKDEGTITPKDLYDALMSKNKP
jgi:hypothetical protein